MLLDMRRARAQYSGSSWPIGGYISWLRRAEDGAIWSEPDRPHYGLIGMRERATALGGQFAAGPTPDGWRVSCSLPLEVNDDLGGARVG